MYLSEANGGTPNFIQSFVATPLILCFLDYLHGYINNLVVTSLVYCPFVPPMNAYLHFMAS